MNKAASKEEIKQVLKVANIRDRAIILFMCQSGLSASDICELKYGDIRHDLEKNIVPINIQKLRHKTGEMINTFVGEEAIEALKLHLKLRRQGTGNRASEKIVDDSPLSDYRAPLDRVHLRCL